MGDEMCSDTQLSFQLDHSISMHFNEHQRYQYLGNHIPTDLPIYSLIFISLLIHCLFYFLLPSSLSPSIKSYIISTFHAFICVLSVGNFFIRYSIDFRQMNRLVGGGVRGTGDEWLTFTISYSVGYFLYDFLLMLFYKSARTISALIHHLIVLIGFFSGFSYRICHPCHFYLLAEELSTIPLNLKTLFRHRSRLHHFFTILFVLSFFLCRILYGSIVCGYAFRTAPEFLRLSLNLHDYPSVVVGLFQAFLCILTRILNFYWAFLILQKLFQLKNKSSSIEKKNV